MISSSYILRCYVYIDDNLCSLKMPKEIDMIIILFDENIAYVEEKINFLNKFRLKSEKFQMSFDFSGSQTIEEIKIKLIINKKTNYFKKKVDVSHNGINQYTLWDKSRISIKLKFEYFPRQVLIAEKINSIDPDVNQQQEKKKINNKNNKNINNMNEIKQEEKINEIEDMDKIQEFEHKNESKSTDFTEIEKEVQSIIQKKSSPNKSTTSFEEIFSSNSNTVNDPNDSNQKYYIETNKSEVITNLLNNLTKRVDNLENDNSILKIENKIIKERVDNLEKENSILKNENKFLKNENSILKERIDNLEKENSILKNENKILKERIEKLEDENSILKNENSILKNENKILKNENKILKERIEKLEKVEQINTNKVEKLTNLIDKNKVIVNSFRIRFLIENFIFLAGNNQGFFVNKITNTYDKLIEIVNQLGKLERDEYNPEIINKDYFINNKKELLELSKNC